MSGTGSDGSSTSKSALGQRVLRFSESLTPALRYASAPAAVAAAALIQYGLLPEPSIAPFVFFYFSIALVSWLAGRGPGLVAVLLAAIVANWLFMPPYRELSLSGPALTASILFLVSAGAVSLLCALFRDTLRDARWTAAVSREREELLRRSEEQLRQQSELVEYASVLVRDTEGKIMLWTKGMERLYGFPPSEALGSVGHELLETRFPQPRADIEAALLRDGTWEGELTHFHRDGRERVVASRWVLHRDGNGQPQAVIEAGNDITDRKRAEVALREADRRKNEFLGVLSHELRNPLSPIQNGLYIVGRSPPGSEQARRALAVIDRQVQQLTRLVDDLLDVTRIERGKVRLRRSRLDLRALASQAAEDHQNLFERNGSRLEVRLADEPVFVNADSTRLVQIIGNLLHNAAKFTPSGSRTTLSTRMADDHFAEILVQDTGSGIAPEVLANLFEPFVQAEKTLERTAGGLGLGLALVKGLAELHGGGASAHSAGAGLGATFVVRIPLERRTTSRLAPVEGGAVTRTDARRLLVIEDNVDGAVSLKEVLELKGYLVELAYTGLEGLRRARTFGPDVVLCDIGLPGMDGFEVARRIRADPELSSATLIALSGYAMPEDVDRAREAGFDLHLAKPLDLGALEQSLSEARRRG